MKFRITRMSNTVPPCEEAVIVGTWANSQEPIYEIEITSLEELIALRHRYGDLILTGDPDEIVIYDHPGE